MSKATKLDFTTLENPFNNNLDRGEGDIGSIADKTGLFSAGSLESDGKDVNKKVSGEDFDDLWIRSWIKSRNYKPKVSGFKLDGKTGKIGCTGLDVWGGTITGAVFQTGESGERVVIDDVNFIQAYDANYLRVKIDPSSLSFYEASSGVLGAVLYGETTGGASGFNADSDYFRISSSESNNAVLYLSAKTYLGTIAMAEEGALAGRLLIQGDVSSPYVSIYGHLIPESDGDAWSLGIPTVRWKDIFITGDISMEAGKTVDGVDISAHVSNADAHHSQSHSHGSHTGIGANDHHSSTSNGIAITPTSVTLTSNITFNTASNVGLFWDTSGENAKLYFDNVSSNCFVFTHSLFVGEAAGKSIRFGDTWISGNADDVSFNQTLEPNADGTLDLGDTDYAWKDLYLSTDSFVKMSGASVLKFETNFVRTQGHLAPFNGDVNDLGNASVKYRNLYIAGKAYIDSNATPTKYIDYDSDGFTVNHNIRPDNPNNYRVGTVDNHFYAMHSANYLGCNLPTSKTGIDIFKKIKSPKLKDGKAKGYHAGKRHYFEISEFPDEMKMTDKDTRKKDIELTRTIGVTVNAVRELIEIIDDLKNRLKVLETKTI